MKKKSLFCAMAAGAVFTAALLPSGRLAAAAIAKDAEVSEENVLALLGDYDPDGAYIIRFGIDSGDDVLTWFDPGDMIIEHVETAVHEQTHGYILQMYRGGQEEIYIGGQQGIHLDYTDTYDSHEMAADVPESLRTFRFDTYVGNPDANMASDIDGVYGLLNEFTAYCWGMNTSVSLYPYYQAEANTEDDWRSYLNELENGKMAYAEFNFYILKYLEYAQQNYPDVYTGIMANENFLQAYTTIEQKYRSLTEQAERYRTEILEAHGGRVEGGFAYIGTTGIGVSDDDIAALRSETAQEPYQSIYAQLTAGGTASAGHPVSGTTTVIPGGAQGTTTLPGSDSGAQGTTTLRSTDSSASGTTTLRSTDNSAAAGTVISIIGGGTGSVSRGSDTESTAPDWLNFSNLVLIGCGVTFLIGLLMLLTEVSKGAARKKK